MASTSVYADHPFALIPTPSAKLPEGTQPTMYQNVASGMALAHSMFLRYLNSVYLQAPHVKAADEAAFLQWALMWVKAIEEHHHNEEIMFFPAVEKMTGQAGVMDVNIEQHHAFVPGIEALRAYCDGCVAGTLQFAGARVVELIDAFGHVLRQHLFEEIDTLLGLERFGDDKMAGLQAAIDADAKASMSQLGLFSALPACVLCVDVEYEGGNWKHWPPAPPGLFWVCRNLTVYSIASAAKFAPCDKAGRLRPLYGLQNAA